jgi:hypothetical protein
MSSKFRSLAAGDDFLKLSAGIGIKVLMKEMKMADLDPEIQLIQEHCGDLAARIRACRSRVIAMQLRERLCGELQQSCQSAMVQNILQHHVDKLISETFDERGNNKFLEA